MSTLDPEDLNILSRDEENTLVNWIITSNENNTLVFKHQLMKRVVKLSKVAKITSLFAKSKSGKMWYENFLKQHPEIHENDEILLPSEKFLVKFELLFNISTNHRKQHPNITI